MTARWLPSIEWPKLVGTELESVYLHLPASARVWVVEHDEKIVACGSFFDLRHHEGLWVAPGVRHSRDCWRLVGEMIGTGLPFVTASVSPSVSRFIEHCGGAELPGRWYRIGGPVPLPGVPQEEETCRPQ